LGKPLEPFVVLSYLNYFCLICYLLKSVDFANESDLEGGVEKIRLQLDNICMSIQKKKSLQMNDKKKKETQ